MNEEIKIENWNGHKIRFVWHDGEWWAVLGDIAKPLDLQTTAIARRLRTIEKQIKKGMILNHPPSNQRWNTRNAYCK